MNELFLKVTPILKSWITYFIPGLVFAFMADKILNLDFACEYFFYDIFLFYLWGLIVLSIGNIFVKILSPSCIEFSEEKRHYIKKCKYIFSILIGTFVALGLCWLFTLISSLKIFKDENQIFYNLLLIIFGGIISLVAFKIKISKK